MTADTAQLVPPTDGNDAQQPRATIWSKTVPFLRFFVVLYCVTTFLDHMKPPPPTRFDDETYDGAPPAEGGLGMQDRPPRANAKHPRSLARPGTPFSVSVSIRGLEKETDVKFLDLFFEPDFPSRTQVVDVDLTPCISANTTLEAIITHTMLGVSFSQTTPLTTYRPTKTVRQVYLFGGDEKGSITEGKDDGAPTADNVGSVRESSEAGEYTTYFQSVLTLSTVIDFSNPVLPYMEPHYSIDPITNLYAPLLYVNNFWVLSDHLVEINATSPRHQNITITVEPFTALKFLTHQQLQKSWADNAKMGLSSPEQFEEFKRIMLETSPYLLGATFVVTILHMVFEYLAFSNDISFWRGRKDHKGLSLQSLAVNCYFQTVIFLYLFDGDETSYVVLMTTGFGVLTEYWKLSTILKFERKPAEQLAEEKNIPDGAPMTMLAKAQRHFPWKLKFSESYEKHTRTYDEKAMWYLVYCMAPLLAAYTGYSAVYETHKGWYSFIVSTQVRFIYFFGFITMTPQLFINYKMKSVTQLPWRTFVYRALNTVIDDLFAFVVKMPWLHRIACFRDDIVFAILLYQRYVYPVDLSRTEGEYAEESTENPQIPAAASHPSALEDTNADTTTAPEKPTPEIKQTAATPPAVSATADMGLRKRTVAAAAATAAHK